MTTLTLQRTTYVASASVDTDNFSIITEQLDKSLEHYRDTISHIFSKPETRFQMLKNEWASETSHLSSITNMVIHPAYQKIIGMGEIAVPLILNEMKVKPGHWFWALKSITGENPVMPEYKGKISKMTECWLDWGREKGYIK